MCCVCVCVLFFFFFDNVCMGREETEYLRFLSWGFWFMHLITSLLEPERWNCVVSHLLIVPILFSNVNKFKYLCGNKKKVKSIYVRECVCRFGDFELPNTEFENGPFHH